MWLYFVQQHVFYYKALLADKIIKEDLNKIKLQQLQKKERKIKHKEIKKQKKKDRYDRRQKWRQEGRKRYFMYREMDRYYYHFTKTNRTFPDYLQKKLDIMPSNKGYIWRNIWYFGLEQVKEEYPLLMFEKTPYKTLLIHEYTADTYTYMKNHLKLIKREL